LKVSQGYREKNAGIYLQKAISLVDKQLEWIEKQILTEQTALNCPFRQQNQVQKQLKWTGSIVDWVEFIYALYAVGYINNGKVSLKKLFRIMGEVFDFDVKEFSRTFTDIKGRKKGDRTPFLDLMKQLLIERMTEADSKPAKK
jgi:hypothetical protein